MTLEVTVFTSIFHMVAPPFTYNKLCSLRSVTAARRLKFSGNTCDDNNQQYRYNNNELYTLVYIIKLLNNIIIYDININIDIEKLNIIRPNLLFNDDCAHAIN